MQKAKSIIIAALSVRTFVADAVLAGYDVIAIDIFADADTQKIAKQTIVVKQQNGHFDAEDFLQKLAKVDCADIAAFVYGSGFDGNATLLETIAKQLPIFGNLAQTIAKIKHPLDFFKTLGLLRIPYPEISFNKLINTSGWLLKRGGGTGGMHIEYALQDVALKKDEYFQHEVEATPVSLLFLANKNSAQVVGFNLQLIEATANYPYRFAGAVSHYPINEAVTAQLIDYANKLTKHYGLVGLNSLDAIVLDNSSLVLEINPRLSASFGLYQSVGAYLIDLHLQACTDDVNFNNFNRRPKIVQKQKGQRIFYAPFNIKLDDKIVWPEWVTDIPMPHTAIDKDAPVCSVQAIGKDTNQVIELLAARIEQLQALVTNSVN